MAASEFLKWLSIPKYHALSDVEIQSRVFCKIWGEIIWIPKQVNVVKYSNVS